MAYDVDASALAKINRVNTAATTLPAGTRLMLPGHGGDAAVAAAVSIANVAAAKTPETPAIAAAAGEGTCTVRPGDTLWVIAQRYGLRMEDLLHWNRLSRNATLRLGQKLVLSAPDREAAR